MSRDDMHTPGTPAYSESAPGRAASPSYGTTLVVGPCDGIVAPLPLNAPAARPAATQPRPVNPWVSRRISERRAESAVAASEATAPSKKARQ